MFKHGFPPEWSTLKKLVWLVGSGIAGAASGIWKTVTGTLLHLTDALASPMQKCEVTLEPIQAGSGDPSPDNVRPITGWTGCEVWVKDEYDTTLPPTASVTFPDTVYGGKYDFISGDGDGDWVAIVFDGVTNQVNVASTSYIGTTTTRGYKANFAINALAPVKSNSMCECAKWNENVNEQGYQGYFVNPSNGETTIRILNSLAGITSEDTAAQAKAKMNAYLAEHPLKIVYKRAEPIPFTETPQSISTLNGENNVWSNGDSVEITYKAHA